MVLKIKARYIHGGAGRYQKGETYHFHQPVGKQYTYGQGMEQLAEVEQLKLQVELLKKVSKLDEKIDKVTLIKLVDYYRYQYLIGFILDCFKVSRSTYYRWKSKIKPPIHDSLIKKVEEICLKHKFMYSHRTITSLLKKEFEIKVYRIMKSRGWLCRTRIKKSPKLGKLY
ncbi:integrase core domain protein [Streptococcus pseudoporcinus]|uniref:Integrase core domain protein n=1 Tax=Streptococcus pseudoporcinus TaxID=361101 RepID=A0A4V6L098_9STRE|nr:integrase core domain protein [Streptococcus pseudoporcinus]VUC67737.1 integrase core domain protein [Streptococcus pseudoporcinus]VUC98663.1 integrase core domain protein [Streptococcus pseudoporcinus]VUC99054.1 integrase core domain protein [Streptococcus pseudoporcinus]